MSKLQFSHDDFIVHTPMRRSPNKWLLLNVLLTIVLLVGIGVNIFSTKTFFRLEQLIPNPSEKIGNKKEPISKRLDMNLFWQILDLLEVNYLDQEQLSEEELLYGAISGMIGVIGDPYTAFFTPKENTTFQKGLEGIYEGIGAQLGYKDKQLVVVAPLEESPAEQAGIQAGDSILAVDGESTAGWSLAKAVESIRGENGTKVTLTLADREVVVVRSQIKIPAVRLSWKDNEIAHLRILRFGTDTMSEWDQKVKEVKEGNVSGIILDLRNNPGGFLNAAVYLASEFFESGVVVKKETNKKTEEFKVDHACRFCDIRVIVLINKGSASASEILAGALQKRARGSLVGNASFGKGTVQEAIELPDGAAVHITTARWLLPNGESIQEQGLQPDYQIDADEPSGPFGDGDSDAQLQKAIEILKAK